MGHHARIASRHAAGDLHPPEPPRIRQRRKALCGTPFNLLLCRASVLATRVAHPGKAVAVRPVRLDSRALQEGTKWQLRLLAATATSEHRTNHTLSISHACDPLPRDDSPGEQRCGTYDQRCGTYDVERFKGFIQSACAPPLTLHNSEPSGDGRPAPTRRRREIPSSSRCPHPSGGGPCLV